MKEIDIFNQIKQEFSASNSLYWAQVELHADLFKILQSLPFVVFIYQHFFLLDKSRTSGPRPKSSLFLSVKEPGYFQETSKYLGLCWYLEFMMAFILPSQFKEGQCHIVLWSFSKALENWISIYKQNREDGHLLRIAVWNPISISKKRGPTRPSWVSVLCSRKEVSVSPAETSQLCRYILLP